MIEFGNYFSNGWFNYQLSTDFVITFWQFKMDDFAAKQGIDHFSCLANLSKEQTDTLWQINIANGKCPFSIGHTSPNGSFSICHVSLPEGS